MKVKKLKLITYLLAATMLASVALSGCSEGSKATQGNLSSVTKVKVDPVINKEKVFTATDGWPKPPLYQGNVNANGGVGYYAQPMMYDNLFQYVRSTDEIVPKLAESYTNEGDKTIVKLRKDVKWHDGEPFTSKDIWAYYMMKQGDNTPNKIEDIEIPDDYTVVFTWPKPAIFDEYRMITLAPDQNGTIPYHIFKQFVDKNAASLNKAKKATDPKKRGPFGLEITKDIQKELDANWQAFTKFTVDTPIGTGPYKFSKVSDTVLELVKNNDYWDAKNVNYDKIVFNQVPDPSTQLAMLRAGKIDNYNGTPPKDMLESLLAGNKDLIHYLMSDPVSCGIMFNAKKEPFNEVKFRQALVYAIDRKKVREFANYYGTEYTKYSTVGIGIDTLDKWVNKETQAKMTDYTYNLDKASSLLKEIGWKKGEDGIWADKNGKKHEFLIGVPAGDNMILNYSQTVAEQLTAFGIPTKVKSVDASIYWTNAPKGEYDMSTDWIDNTWTWKDPQGYINQWSSWISKLEGLPRDSKDRIDIELEGPNGNKIQMNNWVDNYVTTLDPEKRKEMTNDLAFAINENAFGIGLYQNVTGVWVNTKNIDGNFPMASEIEKNDRNMPLPTEQKDIEDIAKLNLGFSGNLQVSDGKYWPR